MSRKKLIAGFIISLGFMAFFFFCGINNAEKIEASAVGTVNVPGGYLNVRTGASTSSSKLKSGGANVTLSNKQKVTITGIKGDWYKVKFTQNSKSLTGYVAKKYVKVQTGKVATKVYGKMNLTAKLRKSTSTKAKAVSISGKSVSLKKGKKVRILSEKVVGEKKWYKVKVTYSSKNCEGYIQGKRVNVDYNKGLPGIYKYSKISYLTSAAGKKKYVYVNKKIVSIKNKKQVTIIGEKFVNTKKYIRIKFKFNNVTVKGYLPEKYIYLQIVTKLSDPKPAATSTVAPTATSTQTAISKLTDAQFKKHLEDQGFPASYVTRLVALHKNYPNWDYKPFKTNLTWDEATKAESKVGLNLIYNGKSYDWKSTAQGAYNWSTDKYIPFDGTSWVTASEKAVKYYMDPRNFMDERGIFQFESLEYQSGTHTQDGVENILKNTPMYNTSYSYTSSGKTIKEKYSKTFMTAGTKTKVSPYHLASRVKQEVVLSSTSMSSSVSGNVAGYKGIYNFYNIGASNSAGGGAVAKGLAWASSGSTYMRPWNSRYKSIVGGGYFIGAKYINIGQNTLYLQKFDLVGDEEKELYNHQYMANVEAPNTEATKVKNGYGENKKDIPFVFSIPVFKNMPEAVSDVPSGGKNPNNYLKTLTANTGTWGTKFALGDSGTKTYTLSVPNATKSVKLSATAVAGTSTISGTGTKSLSVGTKTYIIKVKSESGVYRSYKVNITRAK